MKNRSADFQKAPHIQLAALEFANLKGQDLPHLVCPGATCRISFVDAANIVNISYFTTLPARHLCYFYDSFLQIFNKNYYNRKLL